MTILLIAVGALGVVVGIFVGGCVKGTRSRERDWRRAVRQHEIDEAKRGKE